MILALNHDRIAAWRRLLELARHSNLELLVYCDLNVQMTEAVLPLQGIQDRDNCIDDQRGGVSCMYYTSNLWQKFRIAFAFEVRDPGNVQEGMATFIYLEIRSYVPTYSVLRVWVPYLSRSSISGTNQICRAVCHSAYLVSTCRQSRRPVATDSRRKMNYCPFRYFLQASLSHAYFPNGVIRDQCGHMG